MPAAKGAPETGLATYAWIVVVTVIIMALLVTLWWLYTDQEAVKKDNADLTAMNARLISPAERSLPYFDKAAEGGPTVVGLLEQARAQTAQWATGDPEDDASTVRTKTRELTQRMVQDGLVPEPAVYRDACLAGALETLYAAYGGLHEQLAAGKAQLDELNQKAVSLAAANGDQREKFDEKITDLEQQMRETEDARARYRGERDEEIAAFDRRIEEIRQQASRDVQDQRNEIDRLKKDLEEAKSRYAQVQAKLGEQQITPKPLQALREPDGVVLAAKPGEDVVYINLGRDAHLTLGLQFAVYSPDTGIPVDGTSKGRLEVVSIYDRSAACRIVERHGNQPILEHDLIANPLYDRRQPLKFMVMGEFDLDGDKLPDRNGAARLESLIEAWGGELLDKVSAQLDFAIVGDPPQEPRMVGEQTPEAAERLKEVREAYDRFTERLRAVQALGIPVLRRDTLLHFLGFAGETLALQ